ncbi:hypothetical protein ES703_94388 [subsurface metagenome]
MPVTKIVPIDRTLADLRDCFRKWDIDLFESIPKDKVDRGYRGPGMVVNYFRANQWQHMECYAFPRKEINLRQCFLLLDRLRIAEQQGVSYAGLSSSTELARATPAMKSHDELMDAYGILGASPDDPDDLINDVYQKKSLFYHPDRPGGSEAKMKRLNEAYEKIMKARGTK